MSGSRSPWLVGVLDLMGGLVVRGVGGRRDEYRPIASRLCDTPEPLRVAEAFRATFGIDELYVADLDAIRGQPPNTAVIEALVVAGYRVTLDAGLRRAADADRLLASGVAGIVAGLETILGPAELTAFLTQVGRERVVFSLDLAGGLPLGDAAAWGEQRWDFDSPERIVRRVVECEVERLIVLDLHAVGEARGPTTTTLCERIIRASPSVRLWTGGGVRTPADIETLTRAGAEGVLVASALHDGGLAALRTDGAPRRR